jgi:hypothetical protein
VKFVRKVALNAPFKDYVGKGDASLAGNQLREHLLLLVSELNPGPEV